ncbi:MAG TPA: AarF/UbiB family protein [Thermoanaerobaculia bacterium]|nr:AarF/UbiB family protein [Thermoanaerobaculia bacterium]
MLKARDLGTYRDLLMLFTRYGRRDFRLRFSPHEFLTPEEAQEPLEPDVRERAAAFAKALEQMGPAYVKFGQVLSTRPDIVPPEYIAALEELQDNIEPFSFAAVEATVENELAVRLSKAFASFDAQPLAAASLGQVHRAVLRDGREVVVKVQRPGVRDQVRNDLAAFAGIARALEEHTEIGRRMNLTAALEQVRLTLLNELNYVQEARNMDIMRENLAQFERIHVPAVVHDLSSARVLTTELVKGRKVSKLTPLALIEHDYADLARVITEAYLKQICVDGFWHSDPHPGNVFIREADGETQLVLLDFGMVSRITHEFQDEVIKLILAISSNRGTEAAEACIRVAEVQDGFDATRFVREIASVVASVQDADVRRINIGQLLFHVIAVAGSNDLRLPPELAMLAKTLLNLDGITRRLDPEYDPKSVIRNYAEQLIAQKLRQKFSPRNFYPALLDLNQLALEFPHRAREIVDLTAAGRLTFGIKLVQAEELLGGIHKVANRITVGLVIAALLVASSLMLRVPSPFELLGYPLLAVAGYLLAAAAAGYLILSTFIRDRHDRERARSKGK